MGIGPWMTFTFSLADDLPRDLLHLPRKRWPSWVWMAHQWLLKIILLAWRHLPHHTTNLLITGVPVAYHYNSKKITFYKCHDTFNCGLTVKFLLSYSTSGKVTQRLTFGNRWSITFHQGLIYASTVQYGILAIILEAVHCSGSYFVTMLVHCVKTNCYAPYVIHSSSPKCTKTCF